MVYTTYLYYADLGVGLLLFYPHYIYIYIYYIYISLLHIPELVEGLKGTFTTPENQPSENASIYATLFSALITGSYCQSLLHFVACCTVIFCSVQDPEST